MSKKIKYWCDSGANIHSRREDETSLSELGLTEEEWHAMSDEQRDDMMREIAWDRADWGYELEGDA